MAAEESSKDSLVLIVKYADGRMDQEYWKPGSPPPFDRPIAIDVHHARFQVIAYGTARDWLYANFDGIRKCLAPQRTGTRWIGDDAIFIINNLRHG